VLAFDVERQVVRVVDGDTFRLESLDPEVQPSHVCRMLGYDAPESFILKDDKWRPTGDLEAKAATERLSELVRDQTVRIRAKRKVNYGRWLCQVWLLNGTSVNER
jgi:endonuclease YncB( thermonuclease family)